MPCHDVSAKLVSSPPSEHRDQVLGVERHGAAVDADLGERRELDTVGLDEALELEHRLAPVVAPLAALHTLARRYADFTYRITLARARGAARLPPPPRPGLARRGAPGPLDLARARRRPTRPHRRTPSTSWFWEMACRAPPPQERRTVVASPHADRK